MKNVQITIINSLTNTVERTTVKLEDKGLVRLEYLLTKTLHAFWTKTKSIDTQKFVIKIGESGPSYELVKSDLTAFLNGNAR